MVSKTNSPAGVVASMTGFARVEGETEGLLWAWEVKSVNSKALDLRFRLPSGFDSLELQLRGLANERLKRGAVSASLSVTQTAGNTGLRVNRDALEQVKVPALRGTLRRVLERALVIHGVGRGGPPHVEMLLDGPRRAALTLASQGIRMGLAAEQALRHLSLAGEAELLSDVETLRHRLQNGGDSSLASLLAKKQAALEQISELERASTLATQRLLRIATALEVASVHVLVAANPRSEEFSQILKDLVSEAQVASEVTREINDPRRNV